MPFIEELDPERLSLGVNSVELCLPSGMNGEVFVQNLRLLAEKETGKHFIESAHLEDSVGDPLEENADATLDGDPSTSLSLSSQKSLVLELSRLVSPDAIALTLSDRASPLGALQCLSEGSWEDILPVEAKEQSLEAGRNLFALPDGVESCQSLRLRLSGEKEVSLQEVEIIGSGVKERIDWPGIQLTSALEHYGNTAMLQGFAKKPSGVNGPVRLSIDGKPLESVTGVFDEKLTREGDPTLPWVVTIEARFPDGSELIEEITLSKNSQEEWEEAQQETGAIEQSFIEESIAEGKYGAVGQSIVQSVTEGKPSKIALGKDVFLRVPAGAQGSTNATLYSANLSGDTSSLSTAEFEPLPPLSVTHLGESAIPPLDPWLINVTAPAGDAYEFLPHGISFS